MQHFGRDGRNIQRCPALPAVRSAIDLIEAGPPAVLTVEEVEVEVHPVGRIVPLPCRTAIRGMQNTPPKTDPAFLFIQEENVLHIG